MLLNGTLSIKDGNLLEDLKKKLLDRREPSLQALARARDSNKTVVSEYGKLERLMQELKTVSILYWCSPVLQLPA